MCAEYTLRGKRKLLEESLGQEIQTEAEAWDLHVRLYSKAPVIVMNNQKELQINEMNFSLMPPGTRYPTFNARLSGWDSGKKKIVKISERVTWKKPLAEQRCLVPMTGFIEPIYLGNYAGHAMEFQSEKDPFLFAAGIYSESVDEKTGELYEGFSLILHTPSDYILEIGHHRQLVLLTAQDSVRWIVPGHKNPEASFEFLLKHRYLPTLDATVARDLSKNWEKKIPEYREKLEKEKNYMKHLE
jgi:putative SOS response-associated peptidase YedK